MSAAVSTGAAVESSPGPSGTAKSVSGYDDSHDHVLHLTEVMVVAVNPIGVLQVGQDPVNHMGNAARALCRRRQRRARLPFWHARTPAEGECELAIFAEGIPALNSRFRVP
ncbi:hypothetical protein EVAR_74198_1 [Eumeta japonica]|uniref:Uncharacterized protein n=1 Tax=Eumeta variegata TaxID=151549 RepID=A0A4C1SFB7_EUMVA|nr:hypothetical protein EVAR_74198_1 [Eumeta japonica]